MNIEGLEGTVHQCAISNDSNDCPRLTSMIMHAGGVYNNDARFTHNVHEHTYMRKGDVGNCGDWVTFSNIWSWSADKLENMEGHIFIIKNFAKGTMIELDSLLVELPSVKSFARRMTHARNWPLMVTQRIWTEEALLPSLGSLQE